MCLHRTVNVQPKEQRRWNGNNQRAVYMYVILGLISANNSKLKTVSETNNLKFAQQAFNAYYVIGRNEITK